MFAGFYAYCQGLAARPSAPLYLALLAFTESCISPFPPDPLYILVLLKNKRQWVYYGTFCVFFSVVGGAVGYLLGDLLYDYMGASLVKAYHWENQIQQFQSWFHRWGVWVILLKGLTPFPFKIVAFASGIAKVPLLEFMVASCLARGMRFYSLAYLIHIYGDKVNTFLQRYPAAASGMIFFLMIGGLLILGGLLKGL